MKTCRTCGRDINRGATQTANRHSVHCLVCLVARSLKTFVYPVQHAAETRRLRRLSAGQMELGL